MTLTAESLAPPAPDAEEQEHGGTFRPKFGPDGLLTAVTIDDATGEVLMVAHMDRTAVAATLRTGEAHYFSRSRQRLWRKGETSGQVQTVRRILVDCDQDALILRVSVGGDGGACHTGARTCFYRALGPDGRLTRTEPALAQTAEPSSRREPGRPQQAAPMKPHPA